MKEKHSAFIFFFFGGGGFSPPVEKSHWTHHLPPAEELCAVQFLIRIWKVDVTHDNQALQGTPAFTHSKCFVSFPCGAT